MLIVLLIILFVLICTYLADKIAPLEKPTHHKLLFIFLWVIMGVRLDVGVDYPVYKEMYEDLNSVHWFAVEPTWYIFVKILKEFGFLAQMYFLLTSGFIVWCFYKAISYLSINHLLSILLFILSGIYFETANTIRQCCAMGTLFLAYYYLLEKQLVIVSVLYVLSMLLHYSAIFGIVLISFSAIKINRYILLSILISCVLLGTHIMNIFINNLLPLVTETTGKYDYTPDSFNDGVTTGLLRYIYCILCMLIIYLERRTTKIFPSAYRLVNMVTAGICIYSIFYTFQPLRRLYLYGFMFIIILLPLVLVTIKPRVRFILECTLSLVLLAFLVKSASNPYSVCLSFI